MDHHKLLLSPWCLVIDKVTMQLTTTVWVPFFKHNQACGPVFQRSIRIRIGYRSSHPWGFVEVSTGTGCLLLLERIILVANRYVSKDKLLAAGKG